MAKFSRSSETQPHKMLPVLEIENKSTRKENILRTNYICSLPLHTVVFVVIISKSQNHSLKKAAGDKQRIVSALAMMTYSQVQRLTGEEGETPMAFITLNSSTLYLCRCVCPLCSVLTSNYN